MADFNLFNDSLRNAGHCRKIDVAVSSCWPAFPTCLLFVTQIRSVNMRRVHVAVQLITFGALGG